ncbi:mannose receptor C type 1-like protein [Aphelenchoides avenae]|nr:mannose receptor C type 1-like protein [Aphelenchus avenae]
MFMAVGGDVICGVCNGNSGDDADCDQQCRDRGLDVGVCITLPPGLQVGAYLCVCRDTCYANHDRVVDDCANYTGRVDNYADHDGRDEHTDNSCRDDDHAGHNGVLDYANQDGGDGYADGNRIHKYAHNNRVDDRYANNHRHRLALHLRGRNCARSNAEHVSIGDAAENAFVHKFHMDQRGDKGCASEASCQLFLGLIRTLNAQGWQWLDGTQYDGGSYKNWALGEPNNFSGHDNCVVMTDDGTWNDIHCHGPRMWLCEKDAKASTTPPTSTATVPTLICEEGWSLFSESCYFLGIGVSPLLKSNCEGRNAHQVTIGDAAENAFVHQYHLDGRGGNGCFGGPSCTLFLGLFRSANAFGWGWADGTPYDGGSYKKWALGEPNNNGGAENCVEMRDDGTWNDASCNSERMWMCEKGASTTTPTTTTSTTATTTPTTPSTTTVTTYSCESGWTHSGQSCYRITNYYGPYANHLIACQAMTGGKGHAATISDNLENFVVLITARGSRASIGCTAVPGCHTYIGLNRVPAGSGPFQWADGRTLGYTNWNANEPNNAGGTENCVEMNDDGTWNDLDCNTNRLFVCEVAATATHSG